MSDLPLGKQVETPKRYWPEILTAIPRAQGREQLSLEEIPFQGWDRWTAWEVAWRGESVGLQVGILDILVPSASAAIFESKSLKLYLNSLFYHQFADLEHLLGELTARLEAVCQTTLQIRYRKLNEVSGSLGVAPPIGICLDDHSADLQSDQLTVASRSSGTRNLYWTHLFRSLCPVTGQPDWASVFVEVQGVALEETGLLGYLLGFADHQGFHESCVERIFMDIWRECEPEELAVTARYTRRGGIDINPYRTSSEALPEQNLRQLRQ